MPYSCGSTDSWADHIQGTCIYHLLWQVAIYGGSACDNPNNILSSRSGHAYYSIQLIAPSEPNRRTRHTDSYVRQQGAPPPADPGRRRARPALTKRLFALT